MIDIEYKQDKRLFIAKGNTFDAKVLLRDCGGVFNVKTKEWEIPVMGIRGLIDSQTPINMSPAVKAVYTKLTRYLTELEELKTLTVHPETPYGFLMKHQAVCNRIAHLFKRFAFFLDTGKTLPLMLAIA